MTKTNRILTYLLWIIYSNILIYASFYYNWKEDLIQIDGFIWGLIGIVTLIALAWMKKTKNYPAKISFRSLALIGICGLITSFLYFGKSFLYEETGYWMVLDRIGYFLLISIIVSIYVSFSMVIFSLAQKDIIKDDNKSMNYDCHYIILFVIQMGILCLYFYALNPGNMSYDTYNQVRQLKGLIPFNTWHPIGHTLFTGLLLKICNNYGIITLFQMFFYSAICSAFYVFLLKHKIRWQLIYLSAITITLLPSVGINVVTQWKDIPFTIGLLWATLIILKMYFDDNYFGKPINALEFAVCMLIISLFRYNGILAFIGLFIYTFVYVIRSKNRLQKRNYFISAIFIISIFILINIILPKQLNAIPNPPGMKLRPIYQGYSALYVYGGEEKLDTESRKLIEGVSSPEEMDKYYDPYFADTISNNTPNFLNNLSKISTKDALKMYIEAFLAYPGVILGDKFNLSLTMWSVTHDRFSYNNAYTTRIEERMIDEFGVRRVENKLTHLVNLIAKYTLYGNYLSHTLIWRSGFYLSLEIIIFFYLLIKKEKSISFFIPLISNGIIVFLTMPAQDYRYLWFIFLLLPFLAFACSIKFKRNKD